MLYGVGFLVLVLAFFSQRKLVFASGKSSAANDENHHLNITSVMHPFPSVAFLAQVRFVLDIFCFLLFSWRGLSPSIKNIMEAIAPTQTASGSSVPAVDIRQLLALTNDGKDPDVLRAHLIQAANSTGVFELFDHNINEYH